MLLSFRPIFCIAALLMFLSGCDRQAGFAQIGGVVTFEGQPIEGNITFLPPDGKGPTSATVIDHGKYAVKVPYGLKRVKIAGYRVTGRRQFSPCDPSRMVDIREQILPECYGEKSQLTCQIEANDRSCDFILKKP